MREGGDSVKRRQNKRTDARRRAHPESDEQSANIAMTPGLWARDDRPERRAGRFLCVTNALCETVVRLDCRVPPATTATFSAMSQTHTDEQTESADSTETITRTTIPVSVEVRDELFSLKTPTDSYDDVLRRTLEIEN